MSDHRTGGDALLPSRDTFAAPPHRHHENPGINPEFVTATSPHDRGVESRAKRAARTKERTHATNADRVDADRSDARDREPLRPAPARHRGFRVRGNDHRQGNLWRYQRVQSPDPAGFLEGQAPE